MRRKLLIMLGFIFFLGSLVACSLTATSYESNSTTKTTTENNNTSSSSTINTTSNSTSTNTTTNTTTTEETLSFKKAELIANLTLEFEKFSQSDYTTENYAKIVALKNTGITEINLLTSLEEANKFDISIIVKKMKDITLTTGELPWI